MLFLFCFVFTVIQAGSPAAKDVSAQDMGKRLKLEQWKTQILRNLSMIISRNRIVVHNLPPTLDDEGLRKIIKKHAPPGSRLFEVILEILILLVS
jgi:nucleolar protein 4